MTATDPRQRLLAGLPVTQRRVEPAGISTVVLEGGDGPPLVLLHGGIQCGGVYWAPVMARLAERHRIVVPDVPGLGESDPLDRLDASSFADWFAGLLRITCRDKPVLIAHSLGASLAVRLAAHEGRSLSRLVICGAPAIGPYRLPLGLVARAIRSDLRPSRRNLERFLPWPFRDPDRTRRQDPEWFEAFATYMVARGAVPHVKRTMRQLLRAGTKQVPDSELRRIEVPTALLWGKYDRMTPLRLGEGASARLGWPLHVFHNAGHVPHMESPDEFVREC